MHVPPLTLSILRLFSSLLVGDSILPPSVVPLVVLSDRIPRFPPLVERVTPWVAGSSPSIWVISVRPKKAIGIDPHTGGFWIAFLPRLILCHHNGGWSDGVTQDLRRPPPPDSDCPPVASTLRSICRLRWHPLHAAAAPCWRPLRYPGCSATPYRRSLRRLPSECAPPVTTPLPSSPLIACGAASISVIPHVSPPPLIFYRTFHQRLVISFNICATGAATVA